MAKAKQFIVRKRVELFEDIYFLEATVFVKVGFFKMRLAQKTSSSPSYYGEKVAAERANVLVEQTKALAAESYR